MERKSTASGTLCGCAYLRPALSPRGFPMPPGRKPNLDKRVADLVAQLKGALVAREQARIEAAVGRQVDALAGGLSTSVSGGDGSAAASTAPAKRRGGRPGKRGNRKPRSSASREAARKRMIAYWKAKKGR